MSWNALKRELIGDAASMIAEFGVPAIRKRSAVTDPVAGTATSVVDANVLITPPMLNRQVLSDGTVNESWMCYSQGDVQENDAIAIDGKTIRVIRVLDLAGVAKELEVTQ